MIEVRELNDKQILEVIGRANYGHLGLCDHGDPYVVPIHYAWDGEYIFIYTTEGKKSAIIDKHPHVCLQIEEVKDNENWTSVIINGEAFRVTDDTEFDTAVDLVAKINPTLTPAVSVHWQDNWVRENIPVVYRITALEMSGRRSVPPKPRKR